jgi:phospholipid transport system substrate-binding protein
MKATRRRLAAALGGAVLISFLCANLLLAKPLLANELRQHAASVVSGLVAEIWSARGLAFDAEARQRHLAQSIATSTNIDLLSRLSLGRYWRSLGVAERDAYQNLFAKSVIGSLAHRLESVVRELDGSLDDHFFIIASMPAGKKDVLVRSKVVANDGRPLSVDWRLRESEGGPVIIDLVVEGVSLLVSQRAEFAAVIERSGVGGLIESLKRNARDVPLDDNCRTERGRC